MEPKCRRSLREQFKSCASEKQNSKELQTHKGKLSPRKFMSYKPSQLNPDEQSSAMQNGQEWRTTGVELGALIAKKLKGFDPKRNLSHQAEPSMESPEMKPKLKSQRYLDEESGANDLKLSDEIRTELWGKISTLITRKYKFRYPEYSYLGPYERYLREKRMRSRMRLFQDAPCYLKPGKRTVRRYNTKANRPRY